MRKLRVIRTTPLAACLFTLAALLWCLPTSSAAAPRQATPARPEVRVDEGRLLGQVHDQADEFLGIPYAAPPVGALRFRPPRQPSPWRGERDATRQAPACRQFSLFGLRDPEAVSEDCLYLDVYRPRGTRPGQALPVLFWMHGGAYSQGTGTQFGGRTLASLTGSVVVSVNYRLGQLGYLTLPELTHDNAYDSGSFGLMDQIAALQWTHDNIAAFGGAPEAITISGQSAGSGSVCAMLASPRTKGMFTRAVLQSGPCSLLQAPQRSHSQRDSEEFATAAGCPAAQTRATCLRSATAESLIAAARTHPVSGPAVGDHLLPRQPFDAITDGDWNRVPVLIGSTRTESRFFVALSTPHLTPEEYTDTINRQYGTGAAQVLEHYPLSDYDSPYLALSTVLTDSTFACHTHWTAGALARQVPTYVYEFDDPQSPTLYGAQVPGVDMANAHSAELAYLFDFTMADRPLSSGQVKLADRMKRYWGAFLRSGNPNVRGQTPWPTGDSGSVLELGPGSDRVSMAFASQHQCAFWSSLPAPSPASPA
ncbi:carboxylesterase/lipase family protein [Streptomyces sp. NPDC058249]|uniref:carboxylesterase/lipase family protein n=1 Tax=Streptomyces sp. NPDC058249 TaxID=3346403 RepID=UPI0036E2F23B